MTWLGKILAVLVMLMAVAWMWFTVSVYVARTNWKNQSEMYKDAFEKARVARESEYKVYLSERDALAKQATTERTNASTLAEQLAKAERVKDENVKKIADLDAIIKTSDIRAIELAASLQATLEELKGVRKRSNELEDKTVQLVREKESAEKARLEAQIQARQAEGEQRVAEARLEDVSAQLKDLQTSGGSASASVQNRLNKPPPPVPDGLRGTVTKVDGSFVAVTVGIDAGVAVGMVLDIFRSEGAGQYLGSVVITRVYPKQAVGEFKPANPRQTLKQLRPEQLPKAGDNVGRVGPVLVGAR
jgi:hypothetical protein